MKSVLCSILLILFYTAGFSQQTKPQNHLTKQDYLHKSKIKKTTAWIILGAGAAVWTTSLVWDKGEYEGLRYGLFGDEVYKNDDLKSALAVTGSLVMLGSIPFFISSRKNKRRAMSMGLGLKWEKSTVLNRDGIRDINFPSASFIVGL